MEDYFIQKLTIKDVRDIKNLEIPLDDNERKHLIITGKNGCGKTSTLEEINNLLNKLINNGFATIEAHKKNIKSYKQLIKNTQKNISSYENNIYRETKNKDKLNYSDNLNYLSNKQKILQITNNIKSYNDNIVTMKNNIKSYNDNINLWQKLIDDFAKVDVLFSNQNEIYKDIVNGKFILAYFKAKRENKQTIPQTPTKQSFQKKYDTNFELNKTFLQYMLNLKTTQAFAQIRNDTIEVEEIGKWFGNFENSLKTIFDKDDLKFIFYDKEYKFKIEYEDKSFGLNELSDGYSSLLAIVTELILRMEAHGVKAYDMQGVVLIDEIETHLHVDLQKKVLPFLVSFFPKIQFIVTTHSPFVLSSLSNAVICDLEKRFITSDLSAYSYDALIESYFDSDKYSKEVKEKIEVFEKLADRDDLFDIEQDEYFKLKKYFNTIPTFMADELAVKINEIKLRTMFKVD